MWYTALVFLATVSPGPWVPFETGKGLIQLDVVANGKSGLKFLLDTGAGLTTVDERIVGQLGLKKQAGMTAKGTGGNVAASLVTGLELEVAGTKSKLSAVAIPLSSVALMAGMRMDGIIGHNFLTDHTVEVDYPGKRLRLWKPGDYRCPAGSSVVPITFKSNLPRVMATLKLPDGRSVEAMLKVDTGANLGLLLGERFARRNKLPFDAAGATTSTGGVGGMGKAASVKVASVQMGDFVASSPNARVIMEQPGGALESSDGVVGNEALGKGTLVIDYWARRIVLIVNQRRSGQ